jgi:HlyD family secretion protein
MALAGAAAVLLVAIAAGVFAWLRFTRVYAASARVQAAIVSLSPMADARLLDLCVEPGARVMPGQVLARLDDSELRAALAAAEAARAIEESGHARARAELRLAEARVASDIERARAAAHTAAARVARARAAAGSRPARLAEEVRAAEALRNESRARLQALRRGPREEEVLAAAARLEAAQALHALYEMELEQSRQLATEGIDSRHLLEVRRTRVVTQEKAVREAELELQRLQAGASVEEIAAAEQALANREAGLALARSGSAEVASLEAELAVREAELREAEAQLAQAEAHRVTVSVAQALVGAAAAELKRAEAEERGRRAALQNRDVVSPVTGTVIRTFVRVGEICRRGVPCVLVADDRHPRWVEGFVREADAMRIAVGQRAWVRAPAGTGPYVGAVVEQVGLHTQAPEYAADGGGEAAPRPLQPGRVWVRLRPLRPLADDLVTGTSAQAVIRNR